MVNGTVVGCKFFCYAGEGQAPSQTPPP